MRKTELLLTLALALSGCATQPRTPPNQVIQAEISPDMGRPQDLVQEFTVAIAFSGGGLRASAFAAGVLEGLAETKTNRGDLLDSLAFLSSVSGGSLTAAYYVLNGRDGLTHIRERVLYRDYESSMNLSLASPANWVRMLRGGLNDHSNFAEVLDKDVFKHATFADLYAKGRPDLWINATDLYHRTSFPFLPGLFSALCSDIRNFSVADAVAASMAVPVVFKPTVLRTYPTGCPLPEASFVAPTLSNPSAPRLMRSVAEAMRNYRDPEGPGFVMLVDGGLTDNFGLSSILISRAMADNAHSPMTAKDAIRLRKLLFLVVDAGRGPSGSWNRRLDGPDGVDSAMAATDAAIDAAARLAADSFQAVMLRWRDLLIQHRCGLSKLAIDDLGGVPLDWRCDDVEFVVELLSFQNAEPVTAARARAIETRLTLTSQEIEVAIQAGQQAIHRSIAIRAFAEQAKAR
ncbi:patatin-like phospholipase family protein [Pelomonas sp. Root405]|uniref:patatin-like phospholipase family protein n=2 Tax=unclassified Roseateles TaxID=2626991 RepID=UPI0012E33B95|nr:patatin-like phospholipase family protein [Pelomonas sp. Root405]